MIEPNVSIIVPVYNVEKYLASCVDSLISQSLTNIEIILVDDGSTDNSGKMCDEYAKKDVRIKVIHQSNRGLGLSRNSGIDLAKGEYIGFIDSDDMVSSVMFEVLYKNAISHSADVSYCNFKKFVDENDVRDIDTREAKIKKWDNGANIRKYILDRIGLPPKSKKDNLYGASVCCGIFAKWIFCKQNTRFVSERQYIAEDMIFDIDVLPNCRCIVHQDTPLYYYRHNPASLTTVYKGNRFEKNVELYCEMKRRLNKYFNSEEYFEAMSRYLLTTARIAILQEAKFYRMNGKSHALSTIKAICDNEELIMVLKRYPYWKLTPKYAFTCFLEKYKAIKLLLFTTIVLVRKGTKT